MINTTAEKFAEVLRLNAGVTSMTGNSEQELICEILDQLAIISNCVEAADKTTAADHLAYAATKLLRTLEDAE